MTIAVLDLETIPKELPGIEEEMRASAKGRKGTKDAAKIEAQIEDKVQSQLDKLKFTADGAEIVCAGLGLIDRANNEVNTLTAFSGSIDEILKGVVGYLDQYEVTHLVGYNIDHFDYPILSSALGRSSYRPKNPISKIIDLCVHLAKKETTARKLKGSWNSACRLYGVQEPDLDGSSVLSLYAEGDFATLEKYCLQDVKATGELYLKISKLINL